MTTLRLNQRVFSSRRAKNCFTGRGSRSSSREGLLTTLGSDAANVYVTLTAKQMRPGLKVVALAQDERSRANGRIGRAVGPEAADVEGAAAKGLDRFSHRQHLRQVG